MKVKRIIEEIEIYNNKKIDPLNTLIIFDEIKKHYNKNTYEVDFIVQIGDEIIPIEVKASSNKRSRSLNEYIKTYSPSYAIRLSTHNFGLSNGIKSVPLYAAFQIGREE